MKINQITERLGNMGKGSKAKRSKGMKTSLMAYANVFRQCPMAHIRETFKTLLIKEMETFDMFYEYGKIKAYLHESPPFRP
ncbi:MAG: hypothetical protein KGZ96_12135 [Clostridia bacterium]|jgi:hypothetical protein|nr:hypothetical protein [Clostridia bacterium]